MKQNPLLDRLLSEEKVRGIDYAELAKALGDADYIFQDANVKGRARTWWHPECDDILTVRDLGAGVPMWGDEIDKVARHLKKVERLTEGMREHDAGAAADVDGGDE